jgi:hypothetical protein
MPDSDYGNRLRQSVQTLSDKHRGYFSVCYETPKTGINKALNVKTNAIILESLLYHANGGQPIAR